MLKLKSIFNVLTVVILAIFILQGILLAQAAKYQQQDGPLGLVSMEAENYTDLIQPDYTGWELVLEPEGYSGTGAMQAVPAGEEKHKSIEDAQVNAPYMEYPIHFVKAEPVYVWLRASHKDGYDDSAWFGLDGEIEGTAPIQFHIDEQPFVDTWFWISRLMNANSDRAILEVPSAGLYVFQLYMREPSFKVDKILLTTDEFYVPDDELEEGPPETLAGGGDFLIVIDAEKDAWYDQLTGPSDGLIHMPSRSYLRDVGTPPADDVDLSAVVWMAWDAEYLYCYAEVTDDIVTASHTSRFQNDCIELKIDPNPFEGTGEGTANARLTALGADLAEQPGGVDNLNGSGNLVDAVGNRWEPTEADYARRVIDGGYALEFRIPREYINVVAEGREMVWGEGEVFGMAINVGDNDSGSRDHMIQWSAGHTDQAHSFGEFHGSVTFLPDHKLKFEAVSPRNPEVVSDSAEAWYTNPEPSAVKSAPVLAESFRLITNYPNPFNPETRIQYRIERSETATLAIYSVNGTLIRNLTADRFHVPGTYEITWDGRNAAGDMAGSGIYVCRLITSSMTVSKKMMLMK
ncbi:MAG TPA: T9SS type A sorting domain-containing protein [bacterium]|nr:T9SS type A sorting domain-containing protein [bacterium]